MTLTREQIIEIELQNIKDLIKSFLSIGKRNLTNPKYDGYFEALKEAAEDDC